MSDEKTEEPTDKRLRDSREEGEVAQSVDLVGAVVLCASFGVLAGMRGPLVQALQSLVRDSLAFLDTDRSMASLTSALLTLGFDALRVVAPFALVAVVAAILASLPQVGFTISFEPVAPKLDAISPDKGFKRIFSLKSCFDLGRTIVKAIIIGITLYKAVVLLLPLVVNAIGQPLDTITQVSWTALIRVVGIAVGIFLLIGFADFQFQRWNFIREHRMSKDEVKREHKESEGDPHIKQKRKKLAKEIAFSSDGGKAVKKANVLVVNPTHYAVAIRYVPAENPLPVVIAKGTDELAARLRRMAHEAGIPIVGNPPVARALFKTELYQPIPEPLFEAVAAILRWVDDIGARKLAAADVSAPPS
ncbi:type III secretion system export apparatus subunit SctU [Trinickia sp. LjRoot230]|uniref:type III secretion system export apparatus subunit SctU n=1 Tax=Trinickia sp. LjRoot230 TaxID=3342288 RepID=UPI003ECE3936